MPNGLHAEVETKNAGLDVRVELFIGPGQVALSSEEVSQWVASVYEDAQQILLQRVAVGETSALRLVRYDRKRWEPVLQDPEIVPLPLEQDSRVIGVAAAMAAPAVPSEPTVLQVSEEPSAAAVPTAPPLRRNRQGIERTRQGTKVLSVLRESDRPLDIATVRHRSKLTDYMTRTTLTALAAIDLVVMTEEEIGGRWGTKAVYALK